MSRSIKKHLTENEFIGFILEDLPKDLAEEVDQHLKHCVACAKELEDFYTAREAFPSERWTIEREAFISNLQQKICPGGLLKEQLKSNFPGGVVEEQLRKLQAFFEQKVSYDIGLGFAFKTQRPPIDIESEDTVYGVFIREEANGDIKVYFDSTAMEIEGATIQLYTAKWSKEVTLRKVNDTQVGGKILIMRDERAKMSKRAVLHARLVKYGSKEGSS